MEDREIGAENDSRIPKIPVDKDRIVEFCRRWKITELSLFGSVLRDDFRPESDLDVLVTFAPAARWSLLDLIRMEDELSSMVSRKVDLITRRAVERSENWIRRKAILDSAEPYFVA